MARDRRQVYGREGVTLRQTLVVAVLLHLMLGGALQWRPNLLWSQPVVPPPVEQQPLEFRFVDTPDTEPPAETPDTEVLSDRDRVAQDLSPRNDAEDPFSEGNTTQEVLRGTIAERPGEETAQPTPPVTPPTQPETQPEVTPREEEPSELVADASAADVAEAVTEEAVPPVATAPTDLPPRERTLRNSLARLESFVYPEVYDNPEGGVGGQEGIISFDTKGYDLGSYIREILTIIESNWKRNIPSLAYMPGMKGVTFVELSIVRDKTDPSGEKAVILIEQTWPSEHPSFDQSAVFALEISSPLPPIPTFFPYDNLDGRIGFLINLRADEVTFPPGG